MRRGTLSLTLIIAASWLLPNALLAQEAKIGVVDMERAVVQSNEGKKAETNFTAKLEQYRKDIETRQKHIEDQQNKLKTQDRVLNDAAKAEITRDVEKTQTELKRTQEDAQKELDALRSDLMRPIAQVAEAVVQNYAQEHGFTLIIDRSNPQNNSILFVHPKADITDEIIKLVNEAMAKNAQPKKPQP